MPLSEEEQRILHEMEQRLYDHDRTQTPRQHRDSAHIAAHRSVWWSLAIFVVGLAVLLVSFRSSLLLGTFGFLIMLFALLVFERSARHVYAQRPGPDGPDASPKSRLFSEEIALMGKRLRSKLWRDR